MAGTRRTEICNGFVLRSKGGEKNRFAKEQQGSEQQNNDLQRISKVMICQGVVLI